MYMQLVILILTLGGDKNDILKRLIFNGVTGSSWIF